MKSTAIIALCFAGSTFAIPVVPMQKRDGDGDADPALIVDIVSPGVSGGPTPTYSIPFTSEPPFMSAFVSGTPTEPIILTLTEPPRQTSTPYDGDHDGDDTTVEPLLMEIVSPYRVSGTPTAATSFVLTTEPPFLSHLVDAPLVATFTEPPRV